MDDSVLERNLSFTPLPGTSSSSAEHEDVNTTPEEAADSGPWQSPVTDSNPERFSWERPPTLDRQSLTAAACIHQARAMQETVRERDRQIRILRRELMKVNEENYRLVKELEGYRGKNREELYRENKTLREHLKRVVKENITLRGQQRMLKNPRVSNSHAAPV
ncbi:hypothetical protein BaRGS_00010515 [Batillaria attramentaria]|uniref:BZIP domain-containing protein n=1 Tax=Batillaria attramentaria TaxID=370345 RepID=A0ABD0LFS9_9CAEN